MKNLPLHNQPFESLYREFDKFIRIKGYSRGKKAPYALYVREFLFFIEQKGFDTVQEIKATEITAYYEYLLQRPNQRREGGLSDSYIRGHLFALRLFFDYLLDSEQITSSPARLPKFQITRYKERNVLTLEEIKQLYKVCETKRDRAMLAIAYGCGLRRTEIQNLDTGDVMLHKGILFVRDGKFGKSRTIPLSDKVLKDLKEYLIYERTKYFQDNSNPSNAFFVNQQGNRMNGQKMNNRLKELIEKTKNPEIIRKEITLHCLRHSIATHLIDNGANIEFVQSLLGHSEIDTAHLYSKRRKQQLKILSQIRS